MARALNKLSAIAVDKAKKPGKLSDGGGLYLLVQKTGRKSWVFRCTTKGGTKREMGLGPYPAITLVQARDIADRYRTIVATGGDPLIERERAGGKTFGDCADDYIASVQSEWRNEKHKRQWHQTLKDYCQPIRSRPIADIGTDDILTVLTPIWQSKPETASRLRGRMERVLDFAKARGWRDGENPARWRGHLSSILPKRQKLTRGHFASMDYRDIPEFMVRLQTSGGTSARALEFLILTACRTGEVLGATWDEVDLDARLWTIPAIRMKAGRKHRVPLSGRAVEILTPLSEARLSDLVFAGQKRDKPLSNMAMQMQLRRMDLAEITVHGFRSSFRDWAGDNTTFPREVAEAALAHAVGNATEQAYRRSDALEKRRRLMDAWAEYSSSGG